MQSIDATKRMRSPPGMASTFICNLGARGRRPLTVRVSACYNGNESVEKYTLRCMAAPVITKQHTQEALSMAHIRALAGKAGVNLGLGDTVHDYGIDGTLRHVQIVGNERYESGVIIDIQLKATTDWKSDGTHVIYDLSAKAYNKLVNRCRKANRVLLILLCLPKDENLWLSSTEESLVLRNCCYWEHVTGDPTTNSRSQRIKIPRGKLLTADALREIVESEYREIVGDTNG